MYLSKQPRVTRHCYVELSEQVMFCLTRVSDKVPNISQYFLFSCVRKSVFTTFIIGINKLPPYSSTFAIVYFPLLAFNHRVTLCVVNASTLQGKFFRNEETCSQSHACAGLPRLIRTIGEINPVNYGRENNQFS